MKYAVEIAKAGSINKASEKLLMAQPNLSRSVKELEADLGITIFGRSSKGMFLTPEGEEFIAYAQKIINQIDEVEAMYKLGTPMKPRFSVSVPRASYILDAFVSFSSRMSKDPIEIVYNETNTVNAINNILQLNYKLGVIRYNEIYDRHFSEILEEKELDKKLIYEMSPVVVMNADCPLAQKESISVADLDPYIEVFHGDSTMPASTAKKGDLVGNISRRIVVFEGGSQYTLLSRNTETFMWASPLPEALLKRYGLVQHRCSDHEKRYKDLLIFKKNYKFTEIDKIFIEELYRAKEMVEKQEIK